MLSSDRPFPCIFGVDAVRRRTLRYSFVARGDGLAQRLAPALKEFAGVCHELGRRTSLVVFFEDFGVENIDESQERFWQLLGELTCYDDSGWPDGIATDTEDPQWEFSIFGVPFFVVANTPFHGQRSSRFFEYMAVTFQPRFVFDDIAESTPAGKNARRIIRGRLGEYDSVPPHRSLGSFGSDDNREWTQYFLPDDESTVPRQARCPINHYRSEVQMVGSPAFSSDVAVELPSELVGLLPGQGSIELQHDGPGKIFTWHFHSVDEELFVLDGEITLFWQDSEGAYRQALCDPGVRISLPAGTIHGSVAGSDGATYVIRPLGESPRTEFLQKADWPFALPVLGDLGAEG